MKSDNKCNRIEAGKKIFENPNVQILRLNDHRYTVKSQTSKRKYDVIATESGFICNCPDHTFRKICCKHIHGVEFSIKYRNEVRESNKVTIPELNVTVCPKCTSENFVKHGIRKNKNYSIQRYFCNDCKRWFSFNLGFEGMKASPQIITSAMQLYFTGESLRSVQKFIKLQGITVSHQTIHNWIKKYISIMKEHLDKITPQVSDTWRADEVYTKVQGNMKYLFALCDDETRYWIAKEVSDRKEGHDATGLYREAKTIAKKIPKVMITDGLGSYSIAHKKEFRTNDRNTSVHIRHIHLKGDMNNNQQERFNGEFRDREKVMRGIKKSNSIFFDGYQIFHNYIREHMTLNTTPAEKCGISVEGSNKWLTIIQNARYEPTLDREKN
jgi:transposase-like protein